MSSDGGLDPKECTLTKNYNWNQETDDAERINNYHRRLAKALIKGKCKINTNSIESVVT